MWGCFFFSYGRFLQPLIVHVCVSRGEVISKAGPEETIIYADIGERKEWCDCFYRCRWSRKTKGLLRLIVCTQSLCFHVWPVPRPAVLGRHPAADSHHHSAPSRPLQGDVCTGRIGLNSATRRRWLGKSRLYAADLCLIRRCCFRHGNMRSSLLGR